MQHHGTDPTRLALNAETAATPGDGGTIHLSKGERNRTLTGAEAAALGALSGGTVGADEAALQAAYCAAGGDFIAALRFVHELTALGFIDRVLVHDGREAARLTVFGGGVDPRLPDADEPLRLSRFAVIRSRDGRMVAESPLGRARVALDGRALGALDALAGGAPVRALAEAAGLPETAGRALAGLLLNARVAHRVDPRTGETAEDAAPLSWWEFHDALFHGRSRTGRFDAAYGGTYHRKGRDAPPPFLSPPPDTAPIPLARPDPEALARTDPPFVRVMEARRSIRDYGDARLDAARLGELLWRAARVGRRLVTGDDDMDYSFRPHPGGGAIHELTLYPVIGACDGLDRGVYQYDPEAHALRPLDAAAADVDAMLEAAWITGDRKSRPQVYIAVTARAARMQWKYQSMVYAVILKNVGALYQTLYLAATAMGLAPTALGGGDSDRFARATGRDYWGESLVGEFLIGARP